MKKVLKKSTCFYIIKTTKDERKRKGKDLPNEREKEKKNLRKGGTDRRTHKFRLVIIKEL